MGKPERAKVRAALESIPRWVRPRKSSEPFSVGSILLLRLFMQRRRSRGFSESQTLEKGLKEESAEFVEKGAEVYAKS